MQQHAASSLLWATFAASQPSEPGPGCAIEEGVEFVLDEAWRLDPVLVLVWAMTLAESRCTRRYSVVFSGSWRSQWIGAPSCALWGCRPMACTHGPRVGEPGQSRAAHDVAIAPSGALLWVPTQQAYLLVATTWSPDGSR